MTPRERLKRLWRNTRGKHADTLLIVSPENVRYYSGFSGTSGVILANGQEAHFFTDPRYDLQSREQVKGFHIHITGDKHPLMVLAELALKWKIRSLGVEEARLTLGESQRLRGKIPRLKFIPIQSAISQQRSIKDAGEIKCIERACQISDAALASTLPVIRPGVREREVAEELEFHMRKFGASKPAFDTIVASGPRSALPHGVASDKKLEKGDFVVIDFGAEFEGYKADITRTFLVGTPTTRQKKIWDVVLQAQERGISKIASGIRCRAIDQAPRSYLQRRRLAKYFIHGTGHGVGLDIHEAPTISSRSPEKLRAGMVITVEPGVYIRGWGGVRMEDTLLVTSHGSRSLTKSPKILSL